MTVDKDDLGNVLEPEPPPTEGPELDPASSGDDDVETSTDPATDHMVPSE